MPIQPPTLKSGQLVLRPVVEEKDLPTLFTWRNDSTTLYLWSPRYYPLSFEQFRQEFLDDAIRQGRIQMIVELEGRIIGTIYFYDYSLNDRNGFLGIYLDPQATGHGHGVTALALFLEYLFAYLNLHKAYAYDFNPASFTPLERAGFKLEGCLKGHRYFQGAYHDQRLYAFYREQLAIAERILARHNSGALQK